MSKAYTVGSYDAPYRGGAPSPPRPSGSTKAALVVLVVIVAVIVGMIAFGLFVVLTLEEALRGFGGGDSFGSGIGFGHVTSQDYTVNGSLYWNVSANVSYVHYGQAGLPWSSLRGRLYLKVSAHPDYTEVCLNDSPVLPRPGVAPAGPFLYYEERAGQPDMMDPGDAIGITGVRRALQGCVLQLNDTHRELTRRTSFAVPVLAPAFELGFGEANVTAPQRGVYDWAEVCPVLTVSPATEQVAWTDLRVEVHDYRNGTVHTPAPYPGGTGVDRSRILVFYDEGGTPDGLIGPGDRMIVTGLGRDQRGGGIHLRTGYVLVGNASIPQFFPSPVTRLVLGPPKFSARDSEMGRVCDLELNVTSIDPPDQYLEWSSTRVELCIHLEYMDHWAASDKMRPEPWAPGPYTGASALYNDSDAVHGRVSVGDTLLIKGLRVYSCGGLIVVSLEDATVATVELPYFFPGADWTLGLTWGPLVGRTVGDLALWDLSLNVTEVLPFDVVVDWSELVVDVAGTCGTVELSTMRGPHAPGTSLEAWYILGTTTDRTVRAGDRLLITGLRGDPNGTRVGLVLDGVRIAVATFEGPLAPWPSIDYTTVGLTPGPLAMEYLPLGGTPLWRATIPISVVSPTGALVPFEPLWVRVTWSVEEGFHDNMTYPIGDAGTGWATLSTAGVAAWYVDAPAADGFVGIGDRLMVTGLTRQFEGGHISVNVQGKMLFELPLPDRFQ